LIRSGCPLHRNFEPLIFRLRYLLDSVYRLGAATILKAA
jgi:hypothetical protein